MSLQKPTPRQTEAQRKRLERINRAEKRGVYIYACIGCHSGTRPGNQGSDYCARCIRVANGHY
jgi:hypothetical protein